MKNYNGIIHISNLTIKASSIDAIKTEQSHGFAKLYFNGNSVSIKNDDALKLKRILERGDLN